MLRSAWLSSMRQMLAKAVLHAGSASGAVPAAAASARPAETCWQSLHAALYCMLHATRVTRRVSVKDSCVCWSWNMLRSVVVWLNKQVNGGLACVFLEGSERGCPRPSALERLVKLWKLWLHAREPGSVPSAVSWLSGQCHAPAGHCMLGWVMPRRSGATICLAVQSATGLAVAFAQGQHHKLTPHRGQHMAANLTGRLGGLGRVRVCGHCGVIVGKRWHVGEQQHVCEN